MGFANRQIGAKLCSAPHNGGRIPRFVLQKRFLSFKEISQKLFVQFYIIYTLQILIYSLEYQPHFSRTLVRGNRVKI